MCEAPSFSALTRSSHFEDTLALQEVVFTQIKVYEKLRPAEVVNGNMAADLLLLPTRLGPGSLVTFRKRHLVRTLVGDLNLLQVTDKRTAQGQHSGNPIERQFWGTVAILQ